METAPANDREKPSLPPAGDFGVALDHLLAGAGLDGILSHDLGLFEVHRRKRAGAPIAPSLLREQRATRLTAALAPALVRRIRESSEGPLVLFKGPELAARYPLSGRRFADIDLLTPNAEAVQQSLVSAGFVVDEDGLVGPHHLPPLLWQTVPLQVEIHHEVKWPNGLRPPAAAEIVAGAVPSRLGIDGVLAPRPAHHALILAAHSWTHRPLASLRDLVDIAVLSAETEEEEIRRTAAAWKLTEIWQTTRATIDALFFEGPPTFPLRSWARHLRTVRDRTVFESHLERCLSDYSGLPLGRALLNTPRVLRVELGPAPDETMREKVTRSLAALRHPSMALSRHDADFVSQAGQVEFDATTGPGSSISEHDGHAQRRP